MLIRTAQRLATAAPHLKVVLHTSLVVSENVELPPNIIEVHSKLDPWAMIRRSLLRARLVAE